MYSIDEAKKAIADKKLDNLIKRGAYLIHCDNIKLVEYLRLPYKVIKEHYEKCCNTKEMPLNTYYPRCAKTITEFYEWLPQAHPELMNIFNNTKKRLDYIIERGTGCYTINFKALQEEWSNAQRTFNNDTQEGIALRKYYMARFLESYDIDLLTEFDLFGTMNHTQEQIEQFKSELMELQTDFRNNPQNYFTETILLPDDEEMQEYNE